jgi:hypothetical protein
MAVGKGNVGEPVSLALGTAVGSDEGLDVVGAVVGMAEGRREGAGPDEEGHTAVSEASLLRFG